jgi:transposase
MISLNKKFEILQGHMIEGHSIKELSRESGLSRTTVKKYIREYKEQKSEIIAGGDKIELMLAMSEGPKYAKRASAPRVLTPEVIEIIEGCLRENERKKAEGNKKLMMCGTDIHELLVEKGYKISYPSVSTCVRSLSVKVQEAYIKQTYEYGEVCEFDWCEVNLTISGRSIVYRLAVFTLAGTNIRWGRLYRTEDTQSFTDAHIRFFREVGGIPKCMVYDNMRVVIAKFAGRNEKEATVALKQLSTYYGFRYRFCNIRKGNEKGHVERSVEYVRRKAYSRYGSFESEASAQWRLTETLERINAGKKEELDLERAAMLPLLPDYSSIVRAVGLVDKFSTVSYKRNHYSVPDYLVGREVEIQEHTDEIVIKVKGSEVARHERKYDSQVYTLDIMHYRETLMRKPGSLTGSLCLKQSCAELRALYERHFKENPKEFILSLELLDKHSMGQFAEAAETLRRSGASVSLDSLKMILGNKAYEYQPAPDNEIERACEAQLRRYAEA